MKRLLTFFAIAMAMVCSIYAAPTGEASARQIADKFFKAKPSRFMARPGQSTTRLAYTAEGGRFYIYDRGASGGFVIVAGDDRLPQVLGYGDEGDFSVSTLPPAVQFWMNELNRQIAYLQSHGNVDVYHPVKRETAFGPLLTTKWNQSEPYNNYCPVYTDNEGYSVHAVTGCVATATAQVMKYYQWPPVGRGSHSYVCNVNNMYDIELSADFSQSHYRWDLMLDEYDEYSSAESCDAVARLMSDVGISIDMQYGSASGAWEDVASASMERYFGYGDKGYWLFRDYFSAAEWDQLLVDEIGANRPVMYVGDTNTSGHAFVFDGYDTDGYFHVNWGWGGRYDGYFVASTLNPGNKYDFKYRQRALFGMVPETQVDAVDDVLYLRGYIPVLYSYSAPLGESIGVEINNIAEGNVLDTAGYETWEDMKYYYALTPMKVSVLDQDGAECASEEFSCWNFLASNIPWSSQYIDFGLPQSLEDGEYKLKVFYSVDGGENYDKTMFDIGGKETYARLVVRNDTAYLKDCFLYNTYGVESIDAPAGVKFNQTFDVTVKLSNKVDWLYPGDEAYYPKFGPTGDVYLSMLKDGVEVATSAMCEVMVPTNEDNTYVMQLTAPDEPGLYEVVLKDESGNHIMEMDGYQDRIGEVIAPVYVFPVCQTLAEDFESMEANNNTSDQDVQGAFSKWSFNKSGVRAPGEGRCHGTHSVMLRKGSFCYTTQPIAHNFLIAQASFFNPLSSRVKYTLEYSLDEGASWEKINTLTGENTVEVSAKSELTAMWPMTLTVAQPAVFRIAMTAGSNGSTYVDDFILYYADMVGDVNGDGEVNIADVNAVIDIILAAINQGSADVNGDGEINVNDINCLIDILISH